MKVKSWSLAAEISQDRLHTSIVAAGRSGAVIVVELVGYRDGPDAVGEVLRWRDEREANAVVVDPRSPGATLIHPLLDAGVRVVQPSTGDVVVAHGRFLDDLRAGRLRIVRSSQLTAAVRHVDERRLGGGSALERRGAAVDVGPALAAELAVWSVLDEPDYDVLKSVW